MGFDYPKLLDNIRNPVLNSLNEYSLIIMELSCRRFGACLLETGGIILTYEFCPYLVCLWRTRQLTWL
ncbi:MAG: hypothetical protein AB1401_04085 [Thermodesulfobacteriota bacterium]